ncbi:hypothetical protein A0H81_10744 [Grifola frondosa]|uniref:Uncharacterized protein n=1 Tax=Grifola frondosa TaxID=5627 RepID=A0A1C7LWX5_GRIFR|nr:hypothetical protein A0H81_10744 [Grifola frondosa]
MSQGSPNGPPRSAPIPIPVNAAESQSSRRRRLLGGGSDSSSGNSRSTSSPRRSLNGHSNSSHASSSSNSDLLFGPMDGESGSSSNGVGHAHAAQSNAPGSSAPHYRPICSRCGRQIAGSVVQQNGWGQPSDRICDTCRTPLADSARRSASNVAFGTHNGYQSSLDARLRYGMGNVNNIARQHNVVAQLSTRGVGQPHARPSQAQGALVASNSRQPYSVQGWVAQQEAQLQGQLPQQRGASGQGRMARGGRNAANGHHNPFFFPR